MKKAIVIGATSGIGYGLARCLAQNGYTVGIAGRRKELLNQLASEMPDRFVIAQIDVSATESVEANLGELISKMGRVDLIVYSSGAGELNPELNYAKESASIEVNVRGFTAVATFAYKFFNTQGFGHFVTISSVAGLRGGCVAPAYSASKAYQINYLEGLRQRAKAEGSKIIITDIRPGSVDTAMMKGEGHFWISTSELAVRQIYQSICRRSRIAYISRRWRLVAIVVRLIPNCIYDRMGKM